MSDGPKKAEDSINTFVIALIGVVSTFVVWASVVALQAYYFNTGEALNHEREIAGQSDQLRSVNAEQEGQLNPAKAETVDAAKGTVRVPISYAMTTVVKTLKQNPGASAVPAIGAHDTPTLPAVKDAPKAPEQPTAPAPAPGTEPAAPTDAKPADAKPAAGSTN